MQVVTTQRIDGELYIVSRVALAAPGASEPSQLLLQQPILHGRSSSELALFSLKKTEPVRLPHTAQDLLPLRVTQGLRQ